MIDASVAVIDLDLFKYHAACAGEKRSIEVTHKLSGRSIRLPTRTAFWGHWSKKNGGKLAEINKGRTSPFSVDEFDIEDIQEAEPIANVLHTAKMMVEKDLLASGASGYLAFLGEGESFRVGRSTLKRYKDRGELLKPLLIDEVTEYLKVKFKAEVVSGIECDDKVVMECYGHKNRFALIEDKDFWGCPINVWDRNQQGRGIVDCNKFGRLFLDSKGKVRGEGRLFFYFQLCGLDAIDGYAANSASDKRWGEKSSFNALKDCKDDIEAFNKIIQVYKNLYPEPKQFKGWRGDIFEVDWEYVLNENYDLCRMLRWEGDNVIATDIVDRMVGLE